LLKAFTGLDERLVVAGDGEQRSKLEHLAAGHDNIEIRGFVDDIESVVANATAVIYTPKQEDFRISGCGDTPRRKPPSSA